jgi:hypothetical protein
MKYYLYEVYSAMSRKSKVPRDFIVGTASLRTKIELGYRRQMGQDPF